MSVTLEEFEARKNSYTGSPKKYNKSDYMDLRNEFSWYDVADYEQKNSPYNQDWKAISAIGNGIKRTVKGVLDFGVMLQDLNAEEAKKTNPDFELNPVAQGLRDLSNSEWLKDTPIASASTIGQLGLDVAQGAGQLAVNAVVGRLGGNGAVMGVMGTSIAGSEYDELRDQGVDVETAAKAAAINSLLQTPLEMIGFTKVFKKLPVNSSLRGYAREFAERVLTEGTTEFLQEYPEQVSKIWALNHDKPAEDIAEMVQDELGNITRDAAYSGLIGGILGGTFGGAHMVLDSSLHHAMEKEVHNTKLDIVERQIEQINTTQTNPAVAAAVINSNNPNDVVYIDGEAINEYAQSTGNVKELAQALGVQEEDIKRAAEDGDYLDIRLGNFEAAAAKHKGFFQAVKDDTAFEDGGYTVNGEKLYKQEVEKARRRAADLEVEQDSVLHSMLTAGVERKQANALVTLLTNHAMMMHPENPAQWMKENALRFQKGGSTMGMNQPNQAFKEWFGKSKAIDKEGKPLVVYHGTNAYDLKTFKRGKNGYLGGAIYLTSDKSVAGRYTDFGDIKELNVRIENPLVIEGGENAPLKLLKAIYGEEKGQKLYDKRKAKQDSETHIITNADIKKLTEMGHDGVEWRVGNTVEYAVYDPNQVKSVDNQGTYSREDNNIYKQMNDLITPETKSQMDAIKKTYTNKDGSMKDGYMKAPNGKPTNLTEEQWLMVRTKGFRKWFGEWEAALKVPTILNLPYQKVTVNDSNLNKDEVKEKFESFSGVINQETGASLIFSKGIVGKILKHKGFKVVNIIDSLPSLFESSVLALSEFEEIKEGHKQHPNISLYHHFVNKFDADGKTYYIRFTTYEENRKKPTDERILHSTAISDIEVYEENKKDVSAVRLRVMDPGVAEQTSFVDSKLSQIFDSVNNTSRMVDENGEPLVFYHGTPLGGFTEFKRELNYFTTDKEYADHYQDPGASSDYVKGVHEELGTPMTYAVFLNMRKPFDTRNAKERKIFEEEFYRQWGNGAPLSEKGLPDWTDSDDFKEFFEENDYDYDGLILDEGGVPGENGEVKSRGISYVVFDSNQIKSATDNNGNFDINDPNIYHQEVSTEPYNPRAEVPKVRGGWNENKILKYLKKHGTLSGVEDAARLIAEFDNVDDLKAHMFYHGSPRGASELKPSITMSDRDIERIGGGGYGEKYWGISVTPNKKIASNFSGEGSSVNIYPIVLAKNAVVEEAPELEDAIDIEGQIADYWNRGVDAVWIGDKSAGEQELLILNPRACVNIGTPDFYNVFRLGSESNPLNIKSDEEIAQMLDTAKNREGLSNDELRRNIMFQGVKGTFNPSMENGEYVISLFKGADASTVIHETGHYFIETMWKAIESGQASKQVEKDFDTLLEYAGMTREEWTAADVDGRRTAHERLAEAFETYIMEGKAPSEQLKQAFKRFAEWLREVYKTIRRSENAIPLTDEVREVFDRMLAAQEDIAEAERVNKYFASLPKVITDNMSDATKERVESFIEKARDKAVDVLTRKAMANFTKERKEEIENYRAEILPEVTEEVKARRTYKSGYTKQDIKKYQKLQDIVTGDNEIGRQLTDEEEVYMMQFDLTAENLGYSSSNEMLQDIMNSPTEKQAITQAVNERVKAKYPDIMAEKQAREEAEREAIYNDDTGLLIGVEQQLIEEYATKALNRQEKAAAKREEAKDKAKEKTPAAKTKEEMRERAAAFRQQAKTMAQEAISRMIIEDAIRSQKYVTLERRAAMKSAEAMVKKDYREALTQKNLQAYYHAMVQESIKAKRMVDRDRRYLKRQVKAKREAWFSDVHFAEVSNLFMRMGIAQKKHDNTARIGVSLREYAEAMNEKYDNAEFAEWLLNLPDFEPLSDTKMFTLSQFEDMVNAVRNIRAIAKAEKGANMFDKAESFEALKKDVLKNLLKLKTVFTPDPNKPTQATTQERFWASLENADTFFERMDNWTRGFFTETFFNKIKHANDAEYEYKERYDTAVIEANNEWLPDKAAVAQAEQQVYYEELGTSVSKHVLVKMLMNMGNKDNARRLAETCPIGFETGSIWETLRDESILHDDAVEIVQQNILSFLSRTLTEADVRYAQKMVDAAEMFWSDKNEMEKRVKGFGLKKVEATPQILNIQGKEVVFKGGYFPLIRNGELGSHPVTKEVSADDPLQGRNVRTLHTNSGSSKSRVAGAKYPVNLFPGAETQVIYDSIHDLCWREAVNDFRRVLNDGDIYKALKMKLGPARMAVFREMLEKAAQPNSTHSADFAERTVGAMASWLRNKSANAIIMMNLKINLQNFGNVFLFGQSVDGFTHADTLRALGNYKMNFADAKGYSDLTEFVLSKSAFMRERMTIPDISVRDIQEDPSNKQSEFEKRVLRVGTKLMAYTDGLTAKPVWLEAYRKSLANGKTEQEAVDFADTVIRRTLGSTRMTDVSSLQRGGAIYKLLTMFQSFFNTQYNQWVREKNLVQKQYQEGQKQEAFENAFAFVTSKFVMTCIASLALSLENPFGVDDDDGWPRILKEMKNYGFSMFGPVGQVGSNLVGNMVGMKEFGYRMSVVQSSIEKLTRTGKTVNNIIVGKSKDPVGEAAETVTDVAGFVLGIPQQFNRVVWNMYDVMVHDMDPRLEDLTKRRPKKERKQDSK